MAQHRDAVAHPTHSPEAGNYQENFVAYVSPYIFFDPQANGEDVKAVQELLRHATARMTLDTYTQALGPDKRLRRARWWV